METSSSVKCKAAAFTTLAHVCAMPACHKVPFFVPPWRSASASIAFSNSCFALATRLPHAFASHFLTASLA